MSMRAFALLLISAVFLAPGAAAQVISGAAALPASTMPERIWYHDLATGDRIELLSADAWALAYDSANGVLYFAGDGPQIFRWSPGAAAPTLAFTAKLASGAQVQPAALAFLGGKLYASVTSPLVPISEVNLVSGVLTPSSASLAFSSENLAADPSTGRLYTYLRTPLSGTTPGLYELDPANFASPQLVGAVAPQGFDIDGLAVGGGRAYLIEDSPFPYSIFDFAQGAYLATQLTSPWPRDLFRAAGEFAPGLAAPNGSRIYCSRKPAATGCLAYTLTSGVPSASSGAFRLEAHALRTHRAAMWHYSLAGRASTPFAGGTLCLASPVRRTLGQNTGGSNACSGVVQLDFGAFVQSGADPALVAGAQVNAQLFVRDPGFGEPNNYALSEAVEFVLQP